MMHYLDSARRQFLMYKGLGEKAIAQMNDAGLAWQANEDSNSVYIIVKHLWGNMLSRWTDFLTTDGEKEWRERDAEFDNDVKTRDELLVKWNEGWDCLFAALNTLTDDDLTREVYIRNQGLTVTDA